MGYALSPAAQKSLISIKAYSLKTFGKKRTTIYLKALRDRLSELSTSPLLGLPRDEIKKGFYNYFEGSHTIYYRIGERQIEIFDILHQSMEPSFRL